MKRLLLILSLVLVIHAPLSAFSLTFTWSGLPIVGEDPGFSPEGSAVFDVSGNTLTITLTNTSAQEKAIGQALSILTWDIANPLVTLTPLNAMIASGSNLVGANLPLGPLPTDLSSEWAFRSNISAGSSALGLLGSFGIGAVGDINLGLDTFGPGDRFDTIENLFPPPSGSPNGIEAAIVGLFADLTSGGFQSQGPLVQNTMVFTFDIMGSSLSENDITNVQPLFGTDGATLVPEPTTIVLLGLGLLCMFCIAQFRRRRRKTELL